MDGAPRLNRNLTRRLRNFWRNFKWLLRGRRPGQPLPRPRPRPKPPGPPRVDFSYTIYWTKQVRAWPPERRAAIGAALRPVVSQAGFAANAYERRYRVEGLDDQAHAGASLVALRRVLEAFDQGTKDEG